MIDETWEKVIASCLAKDPARRPQSFVEIAERLEIASPKTVRAVRAIQPPTIAPGSVPPSPPSTTTTTTATSTTMPSLPKPGGLSSAKLALLIGGAGALLFFFLVTLGIWYFVSNRSAPKKAVVTQAST